MTPPIIKSSIIQGLEAIAIMSGGNTKPSRTPPTAKSVAIKKSA
jgi:hypothetical protein